MSEHKHPIEVVDIGCQACMDEIAQDDRAELVKRLRHPANQFLFDPPVLIEGLKLLHEAADALAAPKLSKERVTEIAHEYAKAWLKQDYTFLDTCIEAAITRALDEAK
jgi:hypothetical protein